MISTSLNRSILVAGGLVILAMCLFPPFETGPVDQVGDMLRGEEVATVEYRPIWSHPEWSEGVQGGGVAGLRLVLQIVVVTLLTGLLAWQIGGRQS